MSDWSVVLQQTVAMFLVILAGWVARRRGLISAQATAGLSRFAVDVAMPCLVFTQMLRTVDAAALRAEWLSPLVGVMVVALGIAAGWPAARLCDGKLDRRTFVFLVATPNWIYLPLPIAQALHGEAGVRTVLLVNVGATLAMWSLGMAVLAGKPARAGLLAVAKNAGLHAAWLGIVLALAAPGLGRLAGETSPSHPLAYPLVALLQAMGLVGSMVIPLVLVLTGAQLATLQAGARPPARALGWLLTARLLVAPALTLGLLWAAGQAGLHFAPAPRAVWLLVNAMPVAVSAGMLTERFGGDTVLAARGIFVSTLAGMVTVPALFWAMEAIW